MRKTMLAAFFTVSLAGAVHAENIGVSMALFDDNFLTVLRTGMQDYAKTLDNVNLQVEDAQNDVAAAQPDPELRRLRRRAPSSSTRSTPTPPRR